MIKQLYTNYQIIEEDTFEDLQDTYEFSKKHDSRNERKKMILRLKCKLQIKN